MRAARCRCCRPCPRAGSPRRCLAIIRSSARSPRMRRRGRASRASNGRGTACTSRCCTPPSPSTATGLRAPTIAAACCASIRRTEARSCPATSRRSPRRRSCARSGTRCAPTCSWCRTMARARRRRRRSCARWRRRWRSSRAAIAIASDIRARMSSRASKRSARRCCAPTSWARSRFASNARAARRGRGRGRAGAVLARSTRTMIASRHDQHMPRRSNTARARSSTPRRSNTRADDRHPCSTVALVFDHARRSSPHRFDALQSPAGVMAC